jgi:MFS family permease
VQSPSTSASVAEGHPRQWVILGVLCAALCAIVIDNTILAIAVPSIGRQLHATETDLQWITTSYGLVLSALLLPLAVLGDRYGRRRLFVIGLIIFGLSSLVGAFVGSPTALIISRGAMGAGGACAMPATLAIIGNVFAPHERGRAISVWSSVGGFAGAAGPLIGGLLLSRFWWGSVFLVNVPVVIVGVVAGLLYVPESRDPSAPVIDWPGAVLWTGALGGLLFGIIEGPERGWSSMPVLAPIAATVVLLALFWRRERVAPAPLLSPATARHPGMRAGAAIVPTTFFALFGTQFVLTQWLQGPRGLGTVAASLCFLPNALGSIAGALTNQRLVRRGGHSRAIATGASTMIIGLLLIGISIRADLLPPVLVGLALLGLGQGLVIPSGVELIMTSTPPEQAGSAAGVNETIVEAGGALGIAVMGSVLVARGSYASPLPVAAVLLVLAAAASLRAHRRGVPSAGGPQPSAGASQPGV